MPDKFDLYILQELSTCDSEYYRWTQNIFLQMYKDGLVYHKEVILELLWMIYDTLFL